MRHFVVFVKFKSLTFLSIIWLILYKSQKKIPYETTIIIAPNVFLLIVRCKIVEVSINKTARNPSFLTTEVSLSVFVVFV